MASAMVTGGSDEANPQDRQQSHEDVDPNVSKSTRSSTRGQASPVVPHVLQLQQKKEWLQHQVMQYRAALVAAKDPSPRSSDDAEQLLEKISSLEKQLLEVGTNKSLKELILKRLHTGKALCKWLTEPEVGQGDAAMATTEHQHKELIDVLKMQMGLTSSILQIKEEMKEAEEKSDKLKKYCAEKMFENRELFAALEAAKKEREDMQGSGNNPRLKKARELLEGAVTRVVLLQHIFQGLILGSGINWAENDDTLQLTLSLGQSVSKVLE